MASNLNIDPITRWKLQVEHQDALIIYAENSPDDEIKACELRDVINGFSFDNIHRGKAVLYGETVQYGGSLITSLDDALEFSTLVFALYSKNLEKDRINSQTTNASLWHTIENRARSEMFIPVIWEGGNVSTAYAREKRELDMSRPKGNWENQLKRLINNHLEKRLEREREQEHLRSRYGGQGSPENIGVHVHGCDLHQHDADANGNGTPQFPWNYLRYLVSEKGLFCFGVLGFVVVSLTLRKLKAR